MTDTVIDAHRSVTQLAGQPANRIDALGLVKNSNHGLVPFSYGLTSFAGLNHEVVP